MAFLENLISLADYFDQNGMEAEATEVDQMISKQSGNNDFMSAEIAEAPTDPKKMNDKQLNYLITHFKDLDRKSSGDKEIQQILIELEAEKSRRVQSNKAKGRSSKSKPTINPTAVSPTSGAGFYGGEGRAPTFGPPSKSENKNMLSEEETQTLYQDEPDMMNDPRSEMLIKRLINAEMENKKLREQLGVKHELGETSPDINADDDLQNKIEQLEQKNNQTEEEIGKLLQENDDLKQALSANESSTAILPSLDYDFDDLSDKSKLDFFKWVSNTSNKQQYERWLRENEKMLRETIKHSAHIDRLVSMADKLDEIGAVKEAEQIDEFLLKYAKEIGPYDSKKRQDELVEQDKKQPRKPEEDHHVHSYQPSGRTLSTRYCPDHLGSMLVRIGPRTYQCPLDGKIYNWESGFTDMEGNNIEGGSVAGQTGNATNYFEVPSRIFESRENIMNSIT